MVAADSMNLICIHTPAWPRQRGATRGAGDRWRFPRKRPQAVGLDHAYVVSQVRMGMRGSNRTRR